MDDSASNHFNFVAGVLGFAITIISAAACCRTYLPGAQMKILDELLKETRTIYEKADADGLFPSENFKEASLRMLGRMEESSVSLRERTYNATTTVQEFVALFKGLSQRIMHLSVRVKDLRACLISTSEKERRQRRGGEDGLVHMNDSCASDASISWLTSIDSSINLDTNSSSQQAADSLDRQQGQAAFRPAALSESNQSVDRLRESLAQMGEGCPNVFKGVDADVVAPRNNPSRSSTLTTLIDTSPRGLFYKTLDRFRGWTFLRPGKDTLDATPLDDQDVARLPV
ncbi:hypothetical protein K443DRAFT_93835 [Laccaria amethystina LaAM-08-1]|uniref:Unplaced genomic scaffold K443scaffold_38, whole genome shotgun sequence n=1 Tax=Laccaria amethystina LaAM-08-1 TaxID=1095629 RepID=A0A0C9XGR6_9AGAR|nr:hypothetical protein K443DRAFT_93835 [Laccaria amethystina LaAM-08-1]